MSYTDDEQVEALRGWWRENGRAVIVGVVVAIAGLFGWQQWQAYQQGRMESASSEFAAFREDILSETPAPDAVSRGEAIVERYGSTPYAPLAALLLAQHHVAHGEFEQAADRLRWATENAGSEPVQTLAKLRLARVLAAQQKFDEALALLDPVPAGAFGSDFHEVRGDVLAATGRPADAVAAYRAALEDQSMVPQRRTIIQLKLNDLGVSEEPAA